MTRAQMQACAVVIGEAQQKALAGIAGGGKRSVDLGACGSFEVEVATTTRTISRVPDDPPDRWSTERCKTTTIRDPLLFSFSVTMCEQWTYTAANRIVQFENPPRIWVNLPRGCRHTALTRGAYLVDTDRVGRADSTVTVVCDFPLLPGSPLTFPFVIPQTIIFRGDGTSE
jgi:hypothetical protein